MAIKKIVARAKTVAREVRDVPTAIGTSLSAQQDYRQGNPADRPKMNRNLNQASKNLDRQIVEVARAILKGETGSSSDEMRGYTEYEKGESRNHIGRAYKITKIDRKK